MDILSAQPVEDATERQQKENARLAQENAKLAQERDSPGLLMDGLPDNRSIKDRQLLRTLIDNLPDYV